MKSSTIERLNPQQVRLVHQHLKEILESPAFVGSKRAQDFLKLVVEHALAGQFDNLRERVIGAEMFGRPIGYDTANDSVVRVKATEVRRRLAQYYRETDKAPKLRIELPCGTYVPRFMVESVNHTEPELNDEIVAPPSTQFVGQQPDNVSNSSPSRLSQKHETSRPLRLTSQLALLGAFVVLVIVITGAKLYRHFLADAQAPSIVVLPLENISKDPAQDYFADGITEELIEDLGRMSALRVVSRTSAMSYKGTKKRLTEIARDLSVQWVLEGSVLREGNLVRITVRLIDARTDHQVWTNSYTRDVGDMMALQGEFAQSVADRLGVGVNPQTRERFSGVHAVKAEAEDLYLQGMLCLRTPNVGKAIDYFERAVAADPTFAQPHGALAEAYGRMGETGSLAYKVAFSRQKAEALRAIELDDFLAEGHAQYANAAMNLSWDWTTADGEFQRALDLKPGSVSIHLRHAIYLLRTGKAPAAVAEVEQCMKLDPLSEALFREAQTVYYFSRYYDKAVLVHNDGVARNLDLNNDHFLFGAIYAEKGMYPKAISEFQNRADNPHYLGHLGNAYARAGDTNAASKVVERLKEHVRRDDIGRYEIAIVYAGLGKRDEAFAWLEEAVIAHDEGLTNLKIDPCLDPLRSDPRFSDLVRRVGFPT